MTVWSKGYLTKGNQDIGGFKSFGWVVNIDPLLPSGRNAQQVTIDTTCGKLLFRTSEVFYRRCLVQMHLTPGIWKQWKVDQQDEHGCPPDNFWKSVYCIIRDSLPSVLKGGPYHPANSPANMWLRRLNPTLPEEEGPHEMGIANDIPGLKRTHDPEQAEAGAHRPLI